VSALAVIGTPLALGALPLVEPFDRLAGRPMVAALFKVAAAGFGAERPVEVGDGVALPVLLDVDDGLPPCPVPLDGGGRLAELTQPAGPLQLRRSGPDPATPGQLPSAGLVGAEQGRVPLPPCLALLLGVAGLARPVGGAVGLPLGELGRGLGLGELVAGLRQLLAAQ
jgi:hypothetical protein